MKMKEIGGQTVAVGKSVWLSGSAGDMDYYLVKAPLLPEEDAHVRRLAESWMDSEADESKFVQSLPFFGNVDSACFPDELLPKGSKQVLMIFGKPQCHLGSRNHTADAIGVLRRKGSRMPHGNTCAECAKKYSPENFEVLSFDWHPQVRRVSVVEDVEEISPVPA